LIGLGRGSVAIWYLVPIGRAHMLFKVFEFVDLGATCKSISDLWLHAQNDINRALGPHARILVRKARSLLIEKNPGV